MPPAIQAQPENVLHYNYTYTTIVQPDWKTPLNILIAGFNEKWAVENTEDMETLGYTQLMFSIAARKDSAIQPLVDFIDNATTNKAKFGAIMTLHLIGINSMRSKEGCGCFEDFSNLHARRELLKTLEDDSLRPSVLYLLNRDPWFSDIGSYIDLLRSKSSDYNYLIYSLFRFGLSGFPVQQQLSEDLTGRKFRIPNYGNASVRRKLRRDYPTFMDEEGVEREMLIALSKLREPIVVVEDTLWKMKTPGQPANLTDARYKKKATITLGEALRDLTRNEYGRSSVQYYFESGKLYLVSMATARFRILNWWDSLLPEEKAKIIIEKPLLRWQ